MNTLLRLYAVLTAISGWIESLRVSVFTRVYGISNYVKPPVPWREREGLPPAHCRWPTVEDERSGNSYAAVLVGKVKVGPVKPVPAEFDRGSL